MNTVIWDWNGTILDDIDLCVDIINRVLSKRSLPVLTKEKYREIFTIPVEDYYVEAGFDFSKESFKVLGKEWMDEYEERKYECSLHKNVLETIKALNKLGTKQCILSAYSQDKLEQMVEKFQLTEYFDILKGLDHIYADGKFGLGLELMNQLDLSKGEALMIGDTTHDFEVAETIGADAILIAGGHQNKERLFLNGTTVYQSISEFYLSNFKS